MFKKSPFLVLLLFTSAFGRFSELDLRVEDEARKLVERQARELLAPIADELNALKQVVREPYQIRQNRLQEDRQRLYNEGEDHRREHTEAIRAFTEKKESYQQDIEQRIAEETAGLRAELDAKLKAAEAEIQPLRAEYKRVEEDCYRTKADPVWGRFWDGIDSLGTGMRLGMLASQIEELMSKHQGDLPARIRSLEREIRCKLEETHKPCIEEIERRIQRLEEDHAGFLRAHYEKIEDLEQRLQEERGVEEQAINAAVPQRNLVTQLAQEIEIGFFMGIYRGAGEAGTAE